MPTFTIDPENAVTAYPSQSDVPPTDGEIAFFDSQSSLAKVAANWALNRLVDVFNGVPGQTPVKKFQDRKKAIARIWAAVQPLAESLTQAAVTAAVDAKAAKATQSAKSAKPGKSKAIPAKATRRPGSGASERSNKKAEVIAMMKGPGGATLAEIMKHTGWLPHTVRGFVSILGSKGGQKIESSKSAAGERKYKIG